MDEFSICIVKEIPEEHSAHIVHHELALNVDDKVKWVERKRGRVRESQPDREYDERRTHQREGLFQSISSKPIYDAWNTMDGDEGRRTFPNYCDLFNIVMRSRKGSRNKPANIRKTFYEQIPTSIQAEESLYTQIRSFRDYKCGKICVEPYVGSISIDPTYSDFTMQMRAPLHRKKCDAFPGENLYESALRGYFTIDVPKQKGIGISHSVQTDNIIESVVGESGITSRQFQEISRLGEGHPLKIIYANMLIDFRVEEVLRGMQAYSCKTYGTFDGMIDEQNLVRKLAWRIRKIMSYDDRVHYDFKKKEKIFLDEWKGKIEQQGGIINSPAKFSTYERNLSVLRSQFQSQYSFDIATEGPLWRSHIQTADGRVNVEDWLKWMFKVKYCGDSRYYSDNSFNQYEGAIKRIANEDWMEWKKRILIIIIALFLENNECLEYGRKHWYSTILQACLDLDPQVIRYFREKVGTEAMCGVEISDPTSDLGNYGERSSRTVSYVEMKWDCDEIRADAPIRAINWDVIEKNNILFLQQGFGAVSKGTDEYFDDISVHAFLSYSTFNREGRNLKIHWNYDDEWKKPKRFYSYHYKITREESVINNFFGKNVYEVGGRKYPYPYTEIAPHTREYLQETLMVGNVRERYNGVSERWKWVENELQIRGTIDRVDANFNDRCFISEWGRCVYFEFGRLTHMLFRRVTSEGPHPMFSNFEKDDILDKMNYVIPIRYPATLADALLDAIADIEGSQRLTVDALFYVTHAVDKIAALVDVLPFFKRVVDSSNRQSMYSLNIIPLLLTLSPYGMMRENKIPILIYTEQGVRMIPVSVNNVKSSQNISDWGMYLEGFMSRESGEMTLTEKEQAIKLAFLKYYSDLKIDNRFFQHRRQYKLEMLESWIGVNCRGYVDVLLQMIPIRTPKRGFLLLALCDSSEVYPYVVARVRRLFESVLASNHGIILINVDNSEVVHDKLTDVSISKYSKLEGDQPAIIWLMQTENSKFGNKHMIAKLMNDIA
uniref:Outer capsid protein VP2 n=1 Tax=Palyam virus TaxID=40059 RepID=A0A4P9JFM5_9REOV|nr:VP2 [Palyam virus]